VSAGKKFKGYAAKEHERIFLSPFQKSDGLHMLFQSLVKVAYQNAGSPRKMFGAIREQERIRRAFRRSLFQWFSGGFSHTAIGTRMQQEVESEIQMLENELPGMMKKDRGRALTILQAIGGNIFLLKGIDFALAHQIENTLLEEINTQAADGMGGCWVTFDTYDHHFDDACGTAGSHDSGCCGDSGCSGDGGCSGCGGCGGD
jgi:hypothetical protein